MSLNCELDFCLVCSFCRILMNHKNFDFTQIPGKINDAIFLKSPKTMFWAIFDHFYLMGIFFKKSSCHTQLYMGPYYYAKFQKKLMSQSQENLPADWTRYRQTLLYRTLPAEARDTATSLQQVTGGNTPNLVLRRMLRYFLKIPLLKKILQC